MLDIIWNIENNEFHLAYRDLQQKKNEFTKMYVHNNFCKNSHILESYDVCFINYLKGFFFKPWQ